SRARMRPNIAHPQVSMRGGAHLLPVRGPGLSGGPCGRLSRHRGSCRRATHGGQPVRSPPTRGMRVRIARLRPVGSSPVQGCDRTRVAPVLLGRADVDQRGHVLLEAVRREPDGLPVPVSLAGATAPTAVPAPSFPPGGCPPEAFEFLVPLACVAAQGYPQTGVVAPLGAPPAHVAGDVRRVDYVHAALLQLVAVRRVKEYAGHPVADCHSVRDDTGPVAAGDADRAEPTHQLVEP